MIYQISGAHVTSKYPQNSKRRFDTLLSYTQKPQIISYTQPLFAIPQYCQLARVCAAGIFPLPNDFSPVVFHMQALAVTSHHIVFYFQFRVKAQTNSLIKLMNYMTRGVLPLKLLDLVNQRYEQNAKIYALNHELGFYPVNTKSSIFRGKPSALKWKKVVFPLEGAVV